MGLSYEKCSCLSSLKQGLDYQIICKISPLPGQSGSAIIESKYGELSVIGIHKGAISTKINGNY